MHRSIPIPNKICSQRILETNRKIHIEKLQDSKPTVRSNRNRQLPSLNQAGRYFLENQREDNIKNENRYLLQKITTIMGRESLKSNANRKLKIQSLSTLSNRSLSNSNNKSMNSYLRKKELMNIAIQNERFEKRLQSKKSIYSVKKWANIYKDESKLLENICEYPYRLTNESRHKLTKDCYLTDKSQILIENGDQLFPKCSRNHLEISKYFVSKSLYKESRIIDDFGIVQINIYTNSEFNILLFRKFVVCIDANKLQRKWILYFKNERAQNILKEYFSDSIKFLVLDIKYNEKEEIFYLKRLGIEFTEITKL